MNLEEFKKKYLGKKVDFDKSFGYQCVDLFRQYCNDVWNLPHTGAVEGAKDLFLNYEKLPLEKKYLEKIDIKNLKIGDVIIWGESVSNKWGHVAIFLQNIGETSCLVLEQNGFTQAGVVEVKRDFFNCLGGLRKK